MKWDHGEAKPKAMGIWEFRCFAAEAKILERMIAGDWHSVDRTTEAPAKYGLGPGGLSRQRTFLTEPKGLLLARFHWLEQADGVVRKRFDPKEFVLDGKWYHPLPDGESFAEMWRKDPAKMLPSLWLQKKYGAYRRLRCFLLRLWMED